MKVVHLNTYSRGGAAKACFRVHRALLDAGVDSQVLVLYPDKEFPLPEKVADFRQGLPMMKRFQLKVANKAMTLKHQSTLKKFPPQPELFSFPESVWDVMEHPEVQAADVVHLHWVVDFLDYRSFFKRCNKQIVWTYVDFGVFSEGFHYDFGVDKQPFQRLMDQNISVKQNGIGTTKVEVISISEALTDIAKARNVFPGFHHQTIMLGLIPEEHKMQSQKEALAQLSLSDDKPVVLFLSDHLNYERKGLRYLMEAKNLLQTEVQWLLVGEARFKDIPRGANIRHYPATTDEKRLAVYYAAADVYVNPTLADVGSNTLMEAQMAGCPVVAFPSLGVPEYAAKSPTAFVTKEVSAQVLAQKIDEVLSKQHDREAIHQHAIQVYNMHSLIDRYVELYERLLV